jgi:3-oxoacid CoA-transferase subunit B
MDLAVGAARVVVAMEHTTRDGQPRIVRECSYPITAIRAVSLVVTNLAAIEVTPEGLVVREVAPGVTFEEVQEASEPRLIRPPDLREMEL